MQALNIFHVLVAIALVAFVLIQRGQGATAGAAFGSGASGTVFGARGAGTFLTRTTWVLAALFCSISLAMAVVVSRTSSVPEDNLGVVGSTDVAPASDNTFNADELTLGPDEPVISDVPVLDPGTGSVSGTDDLPVLDEAGIENTADRAEEAVNELSEQAPAAAEESSGEGSGSDPDDS